MRSEFEIRQRLDELREKVKPPDSKPYETYGDRCLRKSYAESNYSKVISTLEWVLEIDYRPNRRTKSNEDL